MKPARRLPVDSLVRPLRLRSKDGREPGRKVTWLELFFDLVFVAAVGQVGEPLAHHYAPDGLLRFALLFVLIWWAWHGHTIFATRFDPDDIVQRLLTLAQMFAVAAMAVNAMDSLDSRDSAGFAAAYAAMRIILVIQYLRARRVPESRALTTVHAAGFGLAAVLWLASSLVPPPWRFALWAVALAIDLGTPIVTAGWTIDVPPDAAHLPERFGLFTIILIGESMVGVMRGMESQVDWSVPAAVSAFLGMAITFTIWWWYFDASRATAERVVRTRGQATRFHVWSYAHLPLYLGIAVAGVGVHHLVAAAANRELHAAESWLLCGAFALVMAGISVVDACADREPGTRAAVPRWTVHIALTSLTIALGALGPMLPPVMLMAALCLLLVLQTLWASHANQATTSGAGHQAPAYAWSRAMNG
jgi:low temperature requirement protein LtrA